MPPESEIEAEGGHSGRLARIAPLVAFDETVKAELGEAGFSSQEASDMIETLMALYDMPIPPYDLSRDEWESWRKTIAEIREDEEGGPGEEQARRADEFASFVYSDEGAALRSAMTEAFYRSVGVEYGIDFPEGDEAVVGSITCRIGDDVVVFDQGLEPYELAAVADNTDIELVAESDAVVKFSDLVESKPEILEEYGPAISSASTSSSKAAAMLRREIVKKCVGGSIPDDVKRSGPDDESVEPLFSVASVSMSDAGAEKAKALKKSRFDSMAARRPKYSYDGVESLENALRESNIKFDALKRATREYEALMRRIGVEKRERIRSYLSSSVLDSPFKLVSNPLHIVCPVFLFTDYANVLYRSILSSIETDAQYAYEVEVKRDALNASKNDFLSSVGETEEIALDAFRKRGEFEKALSEIEANGWTEPLMIPDSFMRKYGDNPFLKTYLSENGGQAMVAREILRIGDIASSGKVRIGQDTMYALGSLMVELEKINEVVHGQNWKSLFAVDMETLDEALTSDIAESSIESFGDVAAELSGYHRLSDTAKEIGNVVLGEGWGDATPPDGISKEEFDGMVASSVASISPQATVVNAVASAIEDAKVDPYANGDMLKRTIFEAVENGKELSAALTSESHIFESMTNEEGRRVVESIMTEAADSAIGRMRSEGLLEDTFGSPSEAASAIPELSEKVSKIVDESIYDAIKERSDDLERVGITGTSRKVVERVVSSVSVNAVKKAFASERSKIISGSWEPGSFAKSTEDAVRKSVVSSPSAVFEAARRIESVASFLSSEERMSRVAELAGDDSFSWSSSIERDVRSAFLDAKGKSYREVASRFVERSGRSNIDEEERESVVKSLEKAIDMHAAYATAYISSGKHLVTGGPHGAYELKIREHLGSALETVSSMMPGRFRDPSPTIRRTEPINKEIVTGFSEFMRSRYGNVFPDPSVRSAKELRDFIKEHIVPSSPSRLEKAAKYLSVVLAKEYGKAEGEERVAVFDAIKKLAAFSGAGAEEKKAAVDAAVSVLGRIAESNGSKLPTFDDLGTVHVYMNASEILSGDIEAKSDAVAAPSGMTGAGEENEDGRVKRGRGGYLAGIDAERYDEDRIPGITVGTDMER